MIRFPAPLSVHWLPGGRSLSSGHLGSPSGFAQGSARASVVWVPSPLCYRTLEVLQHQEKRTRKKERGSESIT